MNRKTIISLGIIAALLLIIVLRNVQFFSDLPDLPSWKGKASEILITKKDTTIRLYQKDGKWIINDAGYPADNSLIQGLEEKMRDLTLTDLISEKKQYDRYDLTKDKAIHVIVKEKDKVLRDVLLGKKASVGRKTYLKLADRSEVYLASGSLDADFNKQANGFRDKNIFTVTKDAIESVTISYKGSSFTLQKEEQKKDIASQKEDKQEKGKEPVAAVKWVFAGRKNVKLDEQAVNNLLQGFSYLKAQSFPPDTTKITGKLCKIEVKAFDRVLSLQIGAKNKEDLYLAKSSETDFPFYLNSYTAEKFMKRMQDLKAK